MITVLSAATLLSEIDSPSGGKCKVTEAMLSDALQAIYSKEDASLMHLSEVRTFNCLLYTSPSPRDSTSS
eukprot:9242832-Prorocentrum_lima.AAC.1